MKILQDFDLTKYNTFGITAHAAYFAEVGSEEDLIELFNALEFKNNEKLFLGSGSNILFIKDFEGIVVLNKIKGIEILEDNEENTLIRSMSGEIWHDLVSFAVEHGLWGIENLSLVPGTVGAAPMQNIGAYGAELKDVLESVEAYEIQTGKKVVFTKEECRLGYRDSIFKNEFKGKYFISAVTLRLGKKENKNLSYKVLSEHLSSNNIEVKGPKDISDAVADIRRSKLPDPELIGNAGSFFKNVFITDDQHEELLKQYPDMPSFKEDGAIKIPAGWLIESCGWKGKRVGSVGVHDKQALVLVNHGGAKGEEVKDLAEKIIASVHEKFGLTLSPEVNLI